MESPVVVDKPPEYHGSSNDRGFPFDEEEGSGAWSELAARHPDIAARLRQRPATWARKRRPSSQDADDFGDSFGGFDRFPFDDIPPEFRDHFPSHWNRRFGSREEPQQAQSQAQPQQQAQTSQSPPQQHTAATQTDHDQPAEQTLPQYGLRNTVDLGQKSPADPSLVDADDRNQRSMSAPPDSRTANTKMSGNHQESQRSEQQPSNVRVIPIVVEGRDEPVINRSADHGHFAEPKPTHVPPQQPHIDRDQYYADDGSVGYNPPPNFTRTFGGPFNKFRQGPQPFVQQKVYPQSATAFGRGASPQRSQSPKSPQQHPEEHYVKVPVHHEQTAAKAEPPSRQQQRQPPQQQKQQPQQQPPQQQHFQQQQAPPQQQTPPHPKPQPSPNDPITLILAIQTDVLNLMSDVENFKGTKKDKEYLYLDEMLTRNLIKLDNIETDGKENIRQARKEAIKCIQKCIAVLEAKAEKGSSQLQSQEVDMKETQEQKTTENGEANENETKEDAKVEAQPEQEEVPQQTETETEVPPEAPDTRPEDKVPEQNVEDKKETENVETKAPKKVTKKRDKSKDKDGNKGEKFEDKTIEKVESMQVDDKGDKPESQTMDVEAASQ